MSKYKRRVEFQDSITDDEPTGLLATRKVVTLYCKTCPWEGQPGAAHAGTSTCPDCGRPAYIRTRIT